MTPSNTKIFSSAALLIAVLTFLTACSSGGNNNNNDKEKTVKTESLTITSYNVGLALNFVPFTNERLVVNEELLADYDNDVVCLQEIWLEEQVEAITDAMSDTYPEIYTVPPEQIFSEDAACSNDDLDGLVQCLDAQCPGLTGADLVSCVPVQCSDPLFQLPPVCLDAVIGSVGIPDVTVDDVIEAVTQPAGKFAFGGALGLILASKYPLEAREFQDFIEDSTSNHRGALYAEITLNDQAHVVGCTHPTANLSIDYPPSGRHDSWEGENRFMQEQMIAFANDKAGENPILFAGDFNCSIANASNGVGADFAENCQLWLLDGFSDPAADELPCTYCDSENLILEADPGDVIENLLLDHIFIKNMVTTKPIVADRVFDDPVSIEATTPPSELQPADSPMMTHPSDHFGAELELHLR
jgi:endonuclease/exonuclease/phosphatase family metal-dependent hydrolase